MMMMSQCLSPILISQKRHSYLLLLLNAINLRTITVSVVSLSQKSPYLAKKLEFSTNVSKHG